MAWTLCSKEDVKSLHPVRDEDLPDQWSEMVEDMIRVHMGAPYLGNPQAITDEYHCGDGTTILRVKKPPIASVSSLSVNETALLASDYVVFTNYVQLKVQTFPRGNLNVIISYTSGTTTIPGSIKLCAIAMIIAILNYERRMGADASIKMATIDRQAGESTQNVNIGLTSHLQAIMKRTLRRSKVRAK